MDIMKKVVFCEITWMKYYCGVADDDKPMNGGSYIAENGEGGEVYNFTPYNHKCYGYVMHQGNELHIERYDKILKSFDEVRDMTVVWVASDGKRCKIVGWYEHAVMYRFWQGLWDPAYWGDYYRNYNFVADENDCYLIDADKRTFVVPRAPQAGAGRGMGQSQVWYADSAYAQNEFIPKVMEYLDSVRADCKSKPFYFLPEEFGKRAEDRGQTTEQLLKESSDKYKEGFVQEAMELVNLALYKDDCYDTRYAKAKLLDRISWYDEAEEEYKQALRHRESVKAMSGLMYVELMLGHTFLASELGEKIRRRKDEAANWNIIASNLTYLYIDEREFDKARLLIQECEQEANAGIHDWIAGAKENMEECRKQL